MGALTLGLLAALCWGVHDLCVRRVSRSAHVPSCLLIVLGTGSVALLGPLATREIDIGSLLVPAMAGQVLGAGAAFVLASYSLYRAFAVGPVRLVAPLSASYPVLTTAFAALGGMTISGGQWLAVIAVIGGIALVASRSPTTSSPATTPAAARDGAVELGPALVPTFAWSLAAAVGFSLTFTLGQAATARLDPVLAMFATRVTALLVLASLILLFGAFRRPRPEELAVLVSMGLLDVFALGMVLYAGRLPDAPFASVTASLFGVVTIVLARVFLAEMMSLRQWLGVGIAFAAIGYLGAG